MLNAYYEQGKSVIIAVGHYNSWELMLTGFNSFIKHKAVVIYQPLSNAFLDKKLCQARSERGTIMLPAKETKKFFQASSRIYTQPFLLSINRRLIRNALTGWNFFTRIRQFYSERKNMRRILTSPWSMQDC